uniref:Nucleotide-diphospho-sugar transferase domain-containing protein n=1 Tax=Meloidogyne incognita TaxID=6306 RepID=A0A914KZ84_MELIC
MEELNAVCGLEWRKFNWSIMSADLRLPLVYAWKIYILAEIYSEYDTFVWMDSAIVLENGASLNSILDGMENSTISEVVFPGSADPPHSVQFATNVRMYNFIPLVSNLIRIEDKWDERMIAAGFNIMHKSEYTRQLLKWALLCAATKQCITPEGSKQGCPEASSIPSCYRYDQSIFALLTINNEYQRYVLNNGETNFKNVGRMAFSKTLKYAEI